MNIKALMAQKWFVPAAVVVGLLIVGAGIRGSSEHRAERAMEDAFGGDADVDRNGDDITVRTDQGEWSTGGKVPSDWPSDVAVYSDAKVLYSASTNPATGSAGSYLALQSSDSAAEIAAYYKSELAAKGWTINSSADISGGTYLAATKDDRVLSLTVTPAEDGSSSILIGVAKKQ